WIRADHAGIWTEANILRRSADIPDRSGESLEDLRHLLRIGILSLVAEEIPYRQSLAIHAVDGVPVSLATFQRIVEPSASGVVLKPFAGLALYDLLAGRGIFSRFVRSIGNSRCDFRTSPLARDIVAARLGFSVRLGHASG